VVSIRQRLTDADGIKVEIEVVAVRASPAS